MTSRLIAACVVAAGLALSPADAEIKVTPVVSEGRVLATFAAPSAWTTEAREMVRGGVALTFAFDVELRRPSMLWVDATLARAAVSSQVKFDTLTKSFQVSKLRDGQVVDSNKSEQEAEVRDWATAFQRVPLEPAQPLEPNAEYYVHVRLVISPRRNVSLWSLWPFSRSDATGRAPFTFIR